jgi:glycosyltransferase involved in cell wall biosynthesis
MNERLEAPGISAIIPVGARRSDLAVLYEDYKAGLAATGRSFECIFVLDGSRPHEAATLQRLRTRGEPVTVVSLTRAFGESTAIMAGFQSAQGRTILTLPAYHQIEPADIDTLVRALDSADLAIAHRWPRYGTRWEALRRRMFHGIIARVTGQRYRDLGCSARCMKRRVLEEISLYGDQHRFLPVLAHRQGFRVSEVDVQQSARDRFEGGYRPREYAHRALDIFTVFFLVRFTKKPLRFFGMVGAVTFGLGLLLNLWLAFDKLVFGHALADRPALLLGSLLMVLGTQVFALGLLGELIIFTHARDIKDYQVDEVIEYRGQTTPKGEARAGDAQRPEATPPRLLVPH